MVIFFMNSFRIWLFGTNLGKRKIEQFQPLFISLPHIILRIAECFFGWGFSGERTLLYVDRAWGEGMWDDSHFFTAGVGSVSGFNSNFLFYYYWLCYADSDYCITLNTCLPIRIQWLNYKIRPQKLVSLGERPVVRTNSGRRERSILRARSILATS